MLRDFVSRHDLMCHHIPQSFYEGLMLGNGDMGAVLWFESNKMIITLDKVDIWERRADQSLEPGINYKKMRSILEDGSYGPDVSLFSIRLPNDKIYGTKLCTGRVEWTFPISPIGFEGKLSIYEAMLSGTVFFEGFQVRVWSYLHANRNVLYLEMEASNGNLPSYKVLPPQLCEDHQKLLASWGYPPPRSGQQGKDQYVSQVFSGDSKYVIYSRAFSLSYTRNRYLLTVPTGKKNDDLNKQASTILTRYELDRNTFHNHSVWWSDFWSRSRIGLPEFELEKLWYLEMYKIGCNMREDKYPVTLMGVWNNDERLPVCDGDLQNDLETEMNYWPIYASNHLELAMPLYRLLKNNLIRFKKNCKAFFGWDGAFVPACMDLDGQGDWELWYPWNLMVGVGPWLAYQLGQHFLYSGDLGFLRDITWPFMIEVGKFLLNFLERDQEGMLHVPFSYSPEYPGISIIKKGYNSTFDLMMARCLFNMIIKVSERLGIDPQTVTPYRNALDHLAPCPVDDTGLMISRDVPLNESHRHFSHLVAIYPLDMLTIEGSDEDRLLINKSIQHLQEVGMGNWAGWSFPWMSLIASRIGRANMAYAMLQLYKDFVITPSTFQLSVDWKRSGIYTSRHGVVNSLEAGTGAAAAIMEMLMQSWRETIRVFPAVPDEWKEVSFESLRAEGAFLVSASYKDGLVEYIRIKSMVGNTCRIRNPWGKERVTIRDLFVKKKEHREGSEFLFSTQKDGEYLIIPTNAPKRLLTQSMSKDLSRNSLRQLPGWS